VRSIVAVFVDDSTFADLVLWKSRQRPCLWNLPGKNARVGSFPGRVAMMGQAQCVERAAECLQAAQSSPGADAQQAWQRLSDTWTAWSKTVVRLRDPQQVSFPRIRPNPSVRALDAIFDPPFGLVNTAGGLQAGLTSPSLLAPRHIPRRSTLPSGDIVRAAGA